MHEIYFLFGTFLIFFGFQENTGEELPEGTPDHTTSCAGTPLRGSCPSGEVIAMKHIQYGTKETCASANCCDYDGNDCLIDYTDTAQQAACSGREVCNEITVAQADTSSCGDPYPKPGLNNYLTMEYYCIPVSRISSIISGSLSQTGTLLYLQNEDYPNPIRATSTNVSCSVEVSSCSSQISVYFLHFELSDGATCSGTQKLKIIDNGSTQTFTCSDNTGYEITLKTTSSSNYITAVLENPAGINEGKLWLGFQATESTAPLKIDCQAEPQHNCKDCSLLLNPQDGSVSFSDNTAYESVATFSCNPGYSLVGNSTRKCQINGAWSNENPSCIINDCGNLTNPINGIVTYSNGTTYLSNATFSCDIGYSLVGGETRTCQANELWTNSDPICEINDCGNLTDPTNGAVTYSSGTKYQSVALFTCITGYSLIGNQTRTCQANTSWSDSDPFCNINDCGNLTDPTNGAVTYSSGTKYQSAAIFSCITGYSLIGDQTRTCQANKTWSDSDPSCEIIDCGNLTDPVNGAVTYSSGSTYQSIATFVCDTGHSLVGDKTRNCQANKTWNGSDPVCNTNDCGSLSIPINGAVNYSHGTAYQSTATFSCDNGYSLVGDQTRTCQANGSWSDKNPSCKINDCANLTNPDNSAVTYSSGTKYQSVATFSCDIGYSLVGDVTRTCQANQTWSASDPECKINDCGNLTDPNNGGVTYSSGTTYQSTATFSCVIGYSLVGNPTRTCESNSTWSNSDPTCEINKCENLASPVNGSVTYTNGTNYQSIATFSCTTGYSVVGNPTRTCQANKSWSGSNPACEINDCGPLNPPAHGSRIYSPNAGKLSVTYSCDPGYSLIGASTRECRSNNSWSDENPICKIKDCNSFDGPENGHVSFSNGTTYKSIAVISCLSNFSLFGSSTRECLANGSWSTAESTCFPDCKSFNDPQNGTVSFPNGTTYKSVAVIVCDTGFSLFGSSTRECLGNGSWTTEETSCFPDCKSFAGPQNGTVKFPNGTNFKSVALIKCDGGFTIFGSSTRECLSDGSWTLELSFCFPNCKTFDGPQNGGVKFPNGTFYKSVAVIDCDSGFSLFGSSTLECLEDGSWTADESSCFPDCDALENPTNGAVSLSDSRRYMSSATFHCDSGFTLIGNQIITCQADGEWSDANPLCRIAVQTTTTVTSIPTPAIEPTKEGPGDHNIIYIIVGTIVGAVLVVSAIAVVTYLVKARATPMKTMNAKKLSKPPPYSASNLSFLQILPDVKIYGLHPELRPQHRDFFVPDFENGEKLTMYSGSDTGIPHDAMRKGLRENGTLTVDNSVDTSQIPTHSSHTPSNFSLSHFIFYKGPAGIDLDSYKMYKG